MENAGPGTIATTGSSNVNNINNRDQYLKHLNKLSHKISKPYSTNAHQSLTHSMPPPPPPSSSQLQQQPQLHNPNQSSLQTQQNQPPVYNINKNDFRDVVQKLTGSPAHERFAAQPPPINQPKPQSSRLQRIRPPPLAHVSNHPSSPIGNSFVQRQPGAAPISPLPPFPAVHAAAESPVSAYMRYFQNSMSSTVDFAPKQFSGFPPLAPLISPRWNNLSAPQQHQQQQPPGMNPSQLPPSTLPFGCLNSPRSPYPLLSPGSLFSPNSGQFGFPLSPTVPLPSPKSRGL